MKPEQTGRMRQHCGGARDSGTLVGLRRWRAANTEPRDAIQTAAYFDWENSEQVEVASLLGDVAEADGKPAIHLHIVVGWRGGSVLAGHLGEAHVRPTLKVILTENPAHLRKRHDPESGLALIRIDG